MTLEDSKKEKKTKIKGNLTYGCTNESRKRVPGLTFHRFPKDPKRRMVWIRAVCRKDAKTGKIWEPSKHSCLCSNHFAEEMFDRTSTKVVRLHEHAVPEIFDGIPEFLKMKPQNKIFTQDIGNDYIHHSQSEIEQDCIPSNKPPQYILKDSSTPALASSSTVTSNRFDSSARSVSPSKEELKEKINILEKRLISKNKQIKLLQQSNRRLKQKVEKLSSVTNKTIRKLLLNCETVGEVC